MANLPFGIITAFLRHLLRPEVALERADLIVQWGLAVKRSRRRGHLLNLTWRPWYEVTRGRKIPRGWFQPPPGVDAALLVATRRPAPLLPAEDYDAFHTYLREQFRRGRGQGRDVEEWVRRYRARRGLTRPQ